MVHVLLKPGLENFKNIFLECEMRDLQKQKILRRGGNNTQKNCTTNDLHHQDYHNGIITHREPYILECKVKWALESITMNKASGSDGWNSS